MLLVGWVVPPANAQELSFTDSLRKYNNERIALDIRAINTLGLWGAANMATGAVGYLTSKNEEWKYFHEMNVAWGAVNTGIAAWGAVRLRQQAKEKFSGKKAVDRYVLDKRLYTINVALDLVYLGAAGGMLQYAAQHPTDNPEMYRGFGKSVLMQGAVLLVFDNLMLLAHRRNSAKWDEILGDMKFTGTSLTCSFPIRQKRTQLPDHNQLYNP
ncbi:MAG: hypothetical protein EBZ77_01910 [Chitinophagia bacterium]|nr:hypothetical protein [Chitinophagia bacterium]